MMKNFLLFHGADFYPRGGMSDFIKDFETLDDAIEFAYKHNHSKCDVYIDDQWHKTWAHIYSIDASEIVWEK